MSTNKGLGRGLESMGLSALIPGAHEKQITVRNIDINSIDANPWQPRTQFDSEELAELASSLQTVGMIQPITLRKNGERFQIIVGERRFRAAQIARMQTIPAYVREAGDEDMLQMALIENIQRSNLNPIDEAMSYQRLIDECDLTQEAMSDRVGKSRTAVTNSLRLLKLPPEIQAALTHRAITVGQARPLVSVSDLQTQMEMFRKITDEGLNARQVEEMVSAYHRAQRGETAAKKGVQTADNSESTYLDIENMMRRRFKTKVKLSNVNGKGRIVIPFRTEDEFAYIVSVMDFGDHETTDTQQSADAENENANTENAGQ